jgi:hypothetical protein
VKIAFEKPPQRRLFFYQLFAGTSLLCRAKVFNKLVENSVEKCGRIFVSSSTGNVSAFCTGAGAGTFRLCGNELGVMFSLDTRD